MGQRVNGLERAELARATIAELFERNAEWFLVSDNAEAQAINRSELDVYIAHSRLVLACWTEQGTRTWKIFSWECTGEKLVLEASRRLSADRPIIELVPRASAKSIALTVKTARHERCKALAELVGSYQPRAKIERIALSPGARRGQPGKYARIVLRLPHQRIAVTGSVAASRPGDVDAFLTSALLWFKRVSERSRAPYVQSLHLLAEKPLLAPLLHRVAFLRSALRDSITVFEIDQRLRKLTLVPTPLPEELWKRRLRRFPPTNPAEFSSVATRIQSIAPDAIDIVSARHGETLRYRGLPFARVRSVMKVEKVWFGLEAKQRPLLDEDTERAFQELVIDLEEHRRAGAIDHHHALYRNAAEAWLESLLRRDITKLDPGLIIAPLHAQFRTSRTGTVSVRPIDLLALRHDGRLAVIELKASEDREHVLQAVDYWQRVEAHRRRGHVQRARLFGERRIKNEPPLIYLVAPTLRVHVSFNTLARSISPDIEIYRFDINEDWRSAVRVMRRLRVN
ncbi:MAG TPA: hypothetical protein VJT50_11050 [Pyrinomonadaceae bacterium]|nr:hypothetical protein [Pyrinomonadaceae bacterium]